MNSVQFINSPEGQPQYVVLPISEYERLAKLDKQAAGTMDKTPSTEWLAIDYDHDDTDEAIIPHAVVSIMITKQVSLLAAWRIYHDLTQQQVAEKLGITQANLSQIEKVDSAPQLKTKVRLAEIYGCSVAQLS